MPDLYESNTSPASFPSLTGRRIKVLARHQRLCKINEISQVELHLRELPSLKRANKNSVRVNPTHSCKLKVTKASSFFGSLTADALPENSSKLNYFLGLVLNIVNLRCEVISDASRLDLFKLELL